MTITHKRWTRLGLSIALAGTAGLAACGDADTPAPEEDAGTAQPGDVAAPSGSDTSSLGEVGEAGEGEGGEGGVDLARARTDRAVYGGALAIVDAHVRAARDAFEAGESDAAAEMFAHPVSEILIDLEPVLEARGVTPFDDQLLAASNAVYEDESVEQVTRRADKILNTLDQAMAAAPQDGSSDAAVAARIAADQIERATQQYRAATGSQAYEPYLDGWGFYRTAEATYREQAEDVRAAAPGLADAIEDALASLAEAYPGAARPDTLDADLQALTVASSNVQLSLQEL